MDPALPDHATLGCGQVIRCLILRGGDLINPYINSLLEALLVRVQSLVSASTPNAACVEVSSGGGEKKKAASSFLLS